MADRPTPLAPPAISAPVAMPAAETQALDTLVGLVVGVVVVVSLYLARSVLLPITLAALLSFLLAPLVRVLRRLKLGRVGSVLVAVGLALGVMVLLAGEIGSQLASLAANVSQYSSTIAHKIAAVQGFATKSLARLLHNAHSFSGPTAAPPVPAAAAAGPQPAPPLPVEVQQPAPSPFDIVRSVLTPVLEPIGAAGIVFTVALFLLLQQEDLRDRMIRLFGAADLHRTTIAIDDAASRLSRYFLTQLAINTGFGIVIATGLAFIGVPSPVLWGVVAALMRFVPYIGVFISASLPMALAAAVHPGWAMLAYTGGLFLGVEFIVGQAVEPMLYGNSTGLSPFSVIVAAIFWSWIWGPVGLIISTPLTLCLVVLGRHVQRLEFLDVLLGDRPALTPVESFYQRMLAGDPDEAQAHAETLLRTRALSSYYDEVAIRGLRLATDDAARGVLNPERMARLGQNMDGLIEELAGYDDIAPNEPPRPEITALPPDPSDAADPPPQAPDPLPSTWSNTPVLCVAGHGPLDASAARMLAQLLGKHGIGARMVENAAANRVNIAALDVTGTAMICVIYLAIEGAPPNLRYLVARLRRRLPAAPILVGLLADSAVEMEMRAAVAADLYVQNLRDAVQACLDAASSQTPRAQTAA